jgi:hypothetical protein
LREGRRHRKLAEMYWALALGEEPRGRPSSKDVCKPQTRHCHELTVTIYPLEFQRRADEKWARAHAPEDSDAKWRLLGLVGGRGLRPRARAWPAELSSQASDFLYGPLRTGPVPNVLREIKAAV